MPPLKKYIFEHTDSSEVKIEIKAHSLKEAENTLKIITRYHSDFKLITNGKDK